MKKLLLLIFLIFIVALFNIVNADEYKGIYVSNNTVYYDCPDGQMAVPEEYNIDIKSVKILNDRFFVDKNNVYNMSIDGHSHFCMWQKLDEIDSASFEFLNDYYQKDKNFVYNSYNYWGWGPSNRIQGADVGTFQLLSEQYAKDKYNVYFAQFMNLKKVAEADLDTFEVLSEDNNYALDKNNMYYLGKVLGEAGEKITNLSLYNNLKGKIILKVEENGEAYYVHPNKQEMHFLPRPVVAFYVMREQGVGITDDNLEKIPLGGYCPSNDRPMKSCDKPEKYDFTFSNKYRGYIFLQVEKNGEAWYVNPSNSKRYYLGRPTDAFNIMRDLGLGVSNNNFDSMIK